MVSIGPEDHQIIRPETLLRWHRAGFRRYRRWNPALLEVDRKSTWICAR
jgi:hypothetical protein